MVLAHKTFKEVHDRVCDLLGLLPCSESDFNQDNIDRPQIKLKRFISLFQQQAMRMMSKQFNTLTFEINTAEGQDTYPVDDLTCIECIKYHSVRNITSGIPLLFMSFEEFRDMYPGGTPDTQGQPTIWVPKYGTAADGADIPNRILFSPIPDGIYTIEYAAQLIAFEITNASDKIVLPPQWEDLIIMGAYDMYKQNIGQGNWMGYIMQVLSQVFAVSSGPQERKMAVSFGDLKIPGVKSTQTGRFRTWNYW